MRKGIALHESSVFWQMAVVIDNEVEIHSRFKAAVWTERVRTGVKPLVDHDARVSLAICASSFSTQLTFPLTEATTMTRGVGHLEVNGTAMRGVRRAAAAPPCCLAVAIAPS